MQFHVKYLSQLERPARVPIKRPARAIHQVLPMAGSQRRQLQLPNNRHRIPEIFHFAEQHAPSGDLPNRQRERIKLSQVIIDALRQCGRVQVAPERLRPVSARILLLAIEFVNLQEIGK